MLTGIVRTFDDARGFGFISRSGGKSVFVHHTSIEMQGYRTLAPGEAVSFVMGEYNGRPCAVSVNRDGKRPMARLQTR